MNVAIVICTHGLTAKQLLKTAEMILGTQSNVAWIDFNHHENTEILIEKYINCIADLNTTTGILFLVDTWGGSPFNAASQIVINKENYEIITGVNIPMLIEVFMTREDNYDFKNLVNNAIQAGRTGIKALKNLEKEQSLSNKMPLIKDLPISVNQDTHMSIVLARIDDRLIHGQVVTHWTKETNIKRIIVVNDEVSKDLVRKTLLTQVAPPGITAHVVDIEKAIRVYNNPKYSGDRVMFLFTNPTDVLRLVDSGKISINSVNIGGMAFYQGKTQITNAVSVDKKDIEAFKKLNELGIELEVRKVPSDTPLKIIDLIRKIDS